MAVDRLVGAEAPVGVEPRLFGDDLKIVQAIRAVIAKQRGAGHLGLALKHRTEPGRQQLRDGAVEIERQRPLRVAPVEPRGARDRRQRADGKSQFRLKGVELAIAIQIEVDRRQAIQLHRMGDQAARRFMHGGAELERVGTRIEGELQAERARRILPLQVENEIETVGGAPERGVTFRAKLCRDAENILAQIELGEGKSADHHLDRQAWRRKPASGCGVPGRLFLNGRGQGLAKQFEMVNFEIADEQSSRQQSRAGPVDMRAVEPQPGALEIRDHHVADHGVGGQGSIDRADRHHHSRRRQGLFDHRDENAFLIFGGRRGVAQPCVLNHAGVNSSPDQRQQQHGNAKIFEDARQKACPMPM